MIVDGNAMIDFAKPLRDIKSPLVTRLDFGTYAEMLIRTGLFIVFTTVSALVIANDSGKKKAPLQTEETLALNNGVLTHTKTDPIREMQARTNAQLALAHQQFMSQLSATDRERAMNERYEAGTNRERAMTERYEAGTNRIVGVASAESIYSVASINYAQARALHAEAYSKELDNILKRVETAWERRKVYEVKRMEIDYLRQIRRSKYLDDQKWDNSRTWERLKNHPELSHDKIATGEALNFLLNKLAAGLLPYEFDARDPEYQKNVQHWLVIDPTELNHINLKMENTFFVASSSGDAEGIKWPQIIGWKEFKSLCEEFEKQRAAIRALSETSEAIPPESIDRLYQTLMDLERVLLDDAEVKRRVTQYRLFTDQYRCRVFIKRLRDEVNFAASTGRLRPHMRYEPSIDGANLISLLTFMSRNGVRFDSASTGYVSTYYELFNKMRALCLDAEENEGNYAPIYVDNAE
jgi:hypothetical protein